MWIDTGKFLWVILREKSRDWGMILKILLLIVLMALPLITVLAHQKPDFTGAWKLNVDKSEFGTLPRLQSRTDLITHMEPSIVDEVTLEGPEGKQEYKVNYTTDGKEVVNQIGSRTVKSTVKWSGADLELNSQFAYNDMDVTSDVTWSMSGDGKTLTFSIHYLVAMGETTQKFVFDKQESTNTKAVSTGLPQSSMPQDPTINNLVLPPGYRTAKLGRLGAVKKSGHGNKDMILIPGMGFDAEIFEGFMNSNASKYTMYAITIPGYGNTPAPPLPKEGTSYGEQTWNKAVESGIVELIDKRKLKKPVVVGHFLQGGQLALRLAIDHPDKISAAIVIGGSAYMFFFDQRDPSHHTPISPEQRVPIVDKYWAQGWFKTVTKKTWDSGMIASEAYTKNPIRAKELHELAAQVPIPVMVQYLCEDLASDITREYQKLKVPTLILIPGFDEVLLARRGNVKARFIDSWSSAAAASHYIQVKTIENSHLFIMDDEPDKLNQLIEDFLKSTASLKLQSNPPSDE